VRVPSINDGTAIVIYYGDAGITLPTEAPKAVWADSLATPGYVGVWHLEQNGTGAPLEFQDSTKNANHGQGGEGNALFLPTRVAGPIGFAQDFAAGATYAPKAPPPDGKYDVIDLGHSPRFDPPGNQITLQAWVRHNITPPSRTSTASSATRGSATGIACCLRRTPTAAFALLRPTATRS
jgi:hypothetical protein